MLKILRELIDKQDAEKRRAYLNDNPHLNLNSGVSALWWALNPPNGITISEGIIKVLLATNNSLEVINAVDKNGDTALMRAASLEETAVVNATGVSEKIRLMLLVDVLIKNIEEGSKGRRTSGIGSNKVKSLKAIVNQLNKEDSEIDIEKNLTQIESVCQRKRHLVHFWAKPHSVVEFHSLVEHFKLKGQPGITTPLKI